MYKRDTICISLLLQPLKKEGYMYITKKNIINLVCGLSLVILPFILPSTLPADEQSQVALRGRGIGGGIGGRGIGGGIGDRGGFDRGFDRGDLYRRNLDRDRNWDGYNNYYYNDYYNSYPYYNTYPGYNTDPYNTYPGYNNYNNENSSYYNAFMGNEGLFGNG